ncbi:Hpr(Ser) kinase/phosphatase [Allofrancisella inopinata]|uniref:Serine/threonine protein kinase n=1 Tax=Allofrancisella inopinata TaxID=1085647 RepID=A0AAE6YH01_9GAMM|nr:serine/threonine protein kinase [Allofrancisella inopinata]QIV95588.1 serine/threonine protein kinase [Allofrancisella inopinata]TDT70723.1 Hpr(Ser) kinase/phosphatase [Allofrancisella inopinata]
MYIYNIFGLIIASEIQLPVCQEKSKLKDQANVFIRFGEVKKHLPDDMKNTNNHTIVKPNNIWLHIKGNAWIHIHDGKYITVELYTNADLQTVCLYLFGSGIGALIHQQGKTIIHGNTIEVNNGCIVFTGDSGAGKSTISTAFYKNGYPFIADDLAVINDKLEVQPGIPRLKVWHDTANILNINTENLDKIRLLVNKYSYPITSNICLQPRVIRAIFLLENHDDNSFKIEELKGIIKLTQLQKHTYRKGYVKRMGYQEQFFKLNTQLAKNIPLYKITRPANKFGFQIDNLIKMVENIINKNLL